MSATSTSDDAGSETAEHPEVKIYKIHDNARGTTHHLAINYDTSDKAADYIVKSAVSDQANVDDVLETLEKFPKISASLEDVQDLNVTSKPGDKDE